MGDFERYDDQGTEVYEVELPPEVIITMTETVHRLMCAEKEAARAREKKDQHRRMYQALESYRAVKRRVNEKYTRDEQKQFRWRFIEDLMRPGKEPDAAMRREDEIVAKDIERLDRIELALRCYEDDVTQERNDEKIRRYKALKMRFIDGGIKTIEEIAGALGISEKTAYKDINMAVDRMSFYMYGFIQLP